MSQKKHNATTVYVVFEDGLFCGFYTDKEMAVNNANRRSHMGRQQVWIYERGECILEIEKTPKI